MLLLMLKHVRQMKIIMSVRNTVVEATDIIIGLMDAYIDTPFSDPLSNEQFQQGLKFIRDQGIDDLFLEFEPKDIPEQPIEYAV